jgi:hypothetical protein
MNSQINKLISIGSQSLGKSSFTLGEQILNLAGNLQRELNNLLTKKNGFYAFESSLHVFQSGSSDNQIITLETWNSEELWRNKYEEFAQDCLFFAEDIFGGQFCIKNNNICSFDPETGELEIIADSLENWAKCILEDYDFFTGFSLAHDWQKKYGLIPPNTKLIPKIPFVFGGEFNLDNLYLLDSVKAMKLRANLAKQILNCPDGTQIIFKLVEND